MSTSERTDEMAGDEITVMSKALAVVLAVFGGERTEINVGLR